MKLPLNAALLQVYTGIKIISLIKTIPLEFYTQQIIDAALYYADLYRTSSLLS